MILGDHFRQINELYGVVVADAFTKEFVKLLESYYKKQGTDYLRQYDRFYGRTFPAAAKIQS